MMRLTILFPTATMLRTPTALLLAALLSAPILAQETAQSASAVEKPPGKDSSLVVAAKKGKARRKRTGKMKITSSELRKSESALTLPAGKPSPPVPAAAATTPAPVSEIALHEKTKVEADHARDQFAKAGAEVDSLERELARLEDDYYRENDAGYRDDVILKRFEQTRRQLEAARMRLRELRESTSSSGSTEPAPPAESSTSRPNG